MNALSRLLRPLDYMRIRHPEKLSYDFIIPAILTALIVALLLLLPKPVQLSGKDGLFAAIVGLLQILTGFYIASLAAIATFKKEGMDQTMPGDPPTLKTSFRGKIRIDQLTRRRFLCLMFGYLAFVSVFLYFVGNGALLVSDNLKLVISAKLYPIVKWSCVTAYLFITSNLIITTLLGLYYMVDRIHRNEGSIEGGQDID